MRDSMVRIVQSQSVDLESVALAAEIIVADARFNLWLATAGKHAPETRMLELVELYEEAAEECRKIAECLDNDEHQRRKRLQAVSAKLNAVHRTPC